MRLLGWRTRHTKVEEVLIVMRQQCSACMQCVGWMVGFSSLFGKGIAPEKPHARFSDFYLALFSIEYLSGCASTLVLRAFKSNLRYIAEF